MQTLGRLYTRFKQMKYAPVTGGIVFDPLAQALDKDETILKLIEGSYHASVGVIIATDWRIFYIGVNRFNKTILEQIRYESISSIYLREPKIISAEITLVTKETGEPLTIVGCDYDEAKEFVELIRMLTLYNNSVAHAQAS